MLCKKLIPAVLAVVALGVSQASAGTVSYIASLGAHQEHFNDISYEAAIDSNANGLLDNGDVLFGIFKIESIGDANAPRIPTPSPGQPEVTGVFAAVVATTTDVGGLGIIFDYTFRPYGAFEGLYGTGAMAALFEGGSGFNAALTPLSSSITTASDGTLLAVAGFTGAGGTAGANEGWSARTFTDSLAAASGYGTSSFGSYQASLNLTNPAAFAPLHLSKSQVSPFGSGFTQLSVNGQLYGKQSGIPAAGWPLGDSTDIFFEVHPIPEPASLLLWTGLAAFAGFRGYRRKTNVVA